jgi:hypothetical protein
MADEEFVRAEKYRVTAPFVYLPQPGPGGIGIVGILEGAIVEGSTIPDARLIAHLRDGMLEPFEMAESATLDEPVDPAAWDMPAANAPLQTWVDYAVAAGWSVQDATGATRDEIAAAFGALDPEHPETGAFIRAEATDGSSVVGGAGMRPARPVATGEVGEPLDEERDFAVGGLVAANPGGRPNDNAAKPAWVNYAVREGATREEAEAMTKAELIKQYGGSSPS